MTKKSLLFLAIIIALVRWQSWGIPLNRDEGAYAYMGGRLFDNDFVLYRDAFEHKPPAIHVLYWLGFKIFGQSELSVRLLGYLNAYLSTLILIQIFNYFEVRGDRKKMLLITYILLSNSFVLEGQLSNTEMFMTTALGACLLLCLRGKYLVIVGGLSAVALLLKPVAITNILLLIVMSRHKLFHFGIGFVLPILLVLGWFYYDDAISDLYKHVVQFNRMYIATGLEVVGTKIDPLVWLIKNQALVSILLFGPLVAFVINKRENRPVSFWGILWLVAYFVGAKITSRQVLHYYYPIIQGATIALASLIYKPVAFKILKATLILFVSLWGWLYLITPKFAYAKTFGPTVRYAYDGREIGRYIGKYTSKADKVLFWLDEPEILFYSQRHPVTRHINTFGTALLGGLEELVSGLENYPKVIVTYGGEEPEWLIQYLSQNQYLIDSSYGSARIYFRK